MLSLILLLAQVGEAKAADKCEIPIVVNLDGIPKGLWGEFSTELWESLKMWDGVQSQSDFRVSWVPVTEMSLPGTVIVKFAPIPGGSKNYIGNTSSKRARDGSILSSLVEVSSSDPWCTSPGQTGCYQIRNTLLHELGHALGLEHSKDKSSIMYYGTAIDTPLITSIPDIDAQSLKAHFPSDGSGCNYRDGTYAWSKLP